MFNINLICFYVFVPNVLPLGLPIDYSHVFSPLLDIYFPGLSAQNESAAAAAAGLLPPMNIQNLAALAAMTQPSLQAVTQQHQHQPSAQLTNAAALLCKYIFLQFTL